MCCLLQMMFIALSADGVRIEVLTPKMDTVPKADLRLILAPFATENESRTNNTVERRGSERAISFHF
jgi:hypothetical protein